MQNLIDLSNLNVNTGNVETQLLGMTSLKGQQSDASKNFNEIFKSTTDTMRPSDKKQGQQTNSDKTSKAQSVADTSNSRQSAKSTQTDNQPTDKTTQKSESKTWQNNSEPQKNQTQTTVEARPQTAPQNTDAGVVLENQTGDVSLPVSDTDIFLELPDENSAFSVKVDTTVENSDIDPLKLTQEATKVQPVLQTAEKEPLMTQKEDDTPTTKEEVRAVVDDICKILEKAPEYNIPLVIQGSLLELKSGLDETLDENIPLEKNTISKVNEALNAILDSAGVQNKDEFNIASVSPSTQTPILNTSTQAVSEPHGEPINININTSAQPQMTGENTPSADKISLAETILSGDSKNLNTDSRLKTNVGNIDIAIGSDLKNLAKPETTLKDNVEQKILNDLNLSIDKVYINNSSGSSSTTQSASEAVAPPRVTVSASEQLVKMSLEEASPAPKTPVETQFAQRLQDAKAQSVPQNQTAPLKELNKTDLLDQIGAKFNQLKEALDAKGNAKITMTLRPIELGRITVELSQSDKGVATNIVAQSHKVKELLEKNIEALRAQLSNAGVSVQNINIKVAANDSDTTFNSDGEHFGDDTPKENLGRDTSDDTDEENEERRS